MSFLGDLFSGGAKGLISGVGGIIDNLTTTDEERAEAKRKMQELVQAHEAAMQQTVQKEMEAKMTVLVAELKQGDGFTKRARPSIIYTGLLIVVASAMAQVIGRGLDVNNLVPSDFWYIWGAVSGTYVIGRTMEKRGAGDDGGPAGLVKKTFY